MKHPLHHVGMCSRGGWLPHHGQTERSGNRGPGWFGGQSHGRRRPKVPQFPILKEHNGFVVNIVTYSEIPLRNIHTPILKVVMNVCVLLSLL